MQRRIFKILSMAWILSSAIFEQVAYAAPSVYYSNLYVGNQWASAGTYDDSIPEEDSQDTVGEIVTDSTQSWTSSTAPAFENLLFEGSLPSTATIQVTYYEYSSTGTGSILGTQTVNSSQIGTKIPVSISGAFGLSFTITDTGSAGGDVYLEETWSNDTVLSSSGEIIWATPPWSTTGTSVGTSSSSSTTTDSSAGTTAVTLNVTTNVTVNAPPPPDWGTITSEIADKIWSEVPPIPAPPGGSDQISSANIPLITPPSVNIANSPQPAYSVPNYQGPAFPTNPPNFTTGYNTITVPTSDSTPFSISDPNSLPHQDPGTIVTPGSVSGVGWEPSDPALDNTSPLPSQSAPTPTSGPSFSGSTSLLGSVPAWTDPGSGSPAGPSATYDTSSSGGPSPSTYSGVSPSYTLGTSVGDIPIWSGDP